MDNQQFVPGAQTGIKKIFTKRNIVVLLIGIIIIELIWSIYTFLKPEQFGFKNPAVPIPNSIELTSAQKSLKVGEKTTVGISITTSEHTDGADIIISYDPKLLSVETADSKPVSIGTLYDDYPQNVLDANVGQITLSGVTNFASGIDANGFMGTITFVAKAPGLAKINILHTPGSTADSNLTATKTSFDILESVQNLEINIVQ